MSHSFENISFAKMMTALAREARTYEEVEGIVLERKETSKPYVMSSTEINQLVTDPAAAIRSMTVPDLKVIVLDKKPILRVGHDTLADAFGDSVYCSRKETGEVECPFCGRWAPLVTSMSEEFQMSLRCGKCNCRLGPVRESQGNWFPISTDVLLECCQERYYIPRSWNKTGPWIGHEDLRRIYEQYKKEKETCLEELQDHKA